MIFNKFIEHEAIKIIINYDIYFYQIILTYLGYRKIIFTQIDNYYQINNNIIHTFEYIKQDSQQLLLCIHGAGSYYGNMFFKNLYQLNINYNILLIDLLGHNKSTGQSYLDFNMNIMYIYDVLKQLLNQNTQIKYLTILGHSNGALMGVVFACYIQYQQGILKSDEIVEYLKQINLYQQKEKLNIQVDKLILVSPRCVPIRFMYSRVDQQSLQELQNGKLKYVVMQFGRSVYQITLQTFTERYLLTLQMVIQMLQTVNNILLIHGKDDGVCDYTESQTIYDNLDNIINKQISIIDNATHTKISIEQIKDCLERFLQ